jgi:transcriptional regulator with XRE-family HTH domain
MSTATQRLGELIKTRREEQGFYTVVEAARHAEISRDTWAAIERGESAKPATYRKVEATLGWLAGSVATVIAGGEPTLAAQAARSSERDELEALRQTLTAALEELDRLQRRAR